MKRALLTGITGQDGSYLAELLINKGYEVHGLVRRSSSFNRNRIDHIHKDEHLPQARLILHYGDLADSGNLTNIIYSIQPDELYNLGAQSHVRVSFDLPEYTGDITGLGTIRILEAIRRSGANTRIYQASSSEMFGNSPAPQNEKSPIQPRSPYAAAKAYSYWIIKNYREGYGMYAVNGILFNHESSRRGMSFVTRKITSGIAGIVANKKEKIYLGNLDARRDWGYAPEFIEAMWLMLQQDQPDDYVIGTGETHSVREFLEEAFSYIGLDWHKYCEIDPRHFRPTEVDHLRADYNKARKELGWNPKVSFSELVRIMVDSDLEAKGLKSPGLGKKILQRYGLNWHKEAAL